MEKNNDPNFGKRMYVKNFALKGNATLDTIENLVTDITAAIGMNKEGLHAAHWKYPAFGGGGIGHTYTQPITESFITVDSWEEHKGLYLFVSSCRKIEDNTPLLEAIERHFSIHEMKEMDLGFD